MLRAGARAVRKLKIPRRDEEIKYNGGDVWGGKRARKERQG